MGSPFAESFDIDFAGAFTEMFEDAILQIGAKTYPISVLATSIAEAVHDEQGRKKSSLASRHFRFILPDGVTSFMVELEHDGILLNGETWKFSELVEGQSVGSKIVKYRGQRGRIISLGKDHAQQ